MKRPFTPAVRLIVGSLLLVLLFCLIQALIAVRDGPTISVAWTQIQLAEGPGVAATVTVLNTSNACIYLPRVVFADGSIVECDLDIRLSNASATGESVSKERMPTGI